MPLREVDRPKFLHPNFITPDGLWQFKVMPFGLVSASASFERMIDLVLAGLKWTSCLTYIDDVIVYARDHEEHRQRLREVFLCLQNANLKLKLKKCHFAEPHLKVLGHIVSEDGIRPYPELLKAVADFPYPDPKLKDHKKLKRIQIFVGTCNFYRRFTENFATMARPLTNLNRKDQPFKFGEEERKSFDALKAALWAAATLAWCRTRAAPTRSPAPDCLRQPSSFPSRKKLHYY